MRFKRKSLALALGVLMALPGFSMSATAEEQQPVTAPEPAQKEQTATVTQGPVNTAGKVRLWLDGGLGFGFDKVDVGTTTKGDTVSISGGGGFAFGAGIGFGLSRSLDLDLDLGGEIGGLSTSVENAEGSFSRAYLLATLKYKVPTSDTGQFKFGFGIGEYFGGKLKFKRTDLPFEEDVEYDPATGVHLTGEFERFLRPNMSFNIGAKMYFVEYKAKTYKFNSVELPVSLLKSEVRDLNGSGMDVLIGINVYFD